MILKNCFKNLRIFFFGKVMTNSDRCTMAGTLIKYKQQNFFSMRILKLNNH